MIYVYLFYGLAFLTLGLVAAWQARSPVRALPRCPLGLLALFALLHGAHEWIGMVILIQSGISGTSDFALLRLGNLILLAISFVFLMQFGIELLIALKQWPLWSRLVPGGLAMVWVGVLVAIARPWAGRAIMDWLPSGEASCRYMLGFTGSLLAAYSLLVASRTQSASGESRISRYLAAGAMAYAAYALFTGLIVPPAPFFPASLLNTETFHAIVGVPIEVFRAICAIAITGLLAEAFIVEAARGRVELERMREEFISVVAHDLRTPITVINLNAELLERLPPQGHETDRERAMLHNIRTSAKNLSRMVEDLLDASRIEAKRLTLHKERIELRGLIGEILERAAEATKGHPVKVVMPDTVPPVVADPGRVEQILCNLLSNAGKYSFPGTEIILKVEVRPPEVVISVTDYGPGIAPQDRSRLFTRFYRTRAAESGKTPGLGLGLYIAKGLVEAQDGRMWVESEVGRYASFRFTLPIAGTAYEHQ